MPPVLSLAVCLFDNVASTDFQGPVELFGFISPRGLPKRYWPTEPGYIIEASYFSVTMDPVYPMSGPALVPTRTYESLQPDEQFDIILVPGGIGSRPGVTPEPVIQFVKNQAPRAKYVLSVCTGAEILARAGALAGRKATTNKRALARIRGDHPEVGWEPRARWVIDGNTWTSAGVTAGTDMAYAFLEHLVGSEVSSVVRNIIELPVRSQEDDEFAEHYKLL
ncbi:uncharacterized protein PHACADRAFT_257967 [Phanerochaete carnosa HHB-10118-sp]|uniref:DJ-1/PfpI domain-containing protein n=1 Tax=Phanerochaete carnosa (strain HHB-10118-sp) TaxID=650164 RepID=K5VRW8_PHACS|nr:uncharacterized protein PHACADRAFT_257967 [Phanerochaete carnosa HHB-10118-sp]EKM54248.1 hypothetical protein PHACADRAFT_257967 [Phanerochaete carnosa HHB-10118-sp]